MESILTSIKKLLGIAEEYEHFDTDVIIHINTTLMTLAQIGVGPLEGFRIEDKTATWDDFIPNASRLKLEGVKTYIYQKVKLVFDPPQSSTAVEALKQSIAELEWRLNVAVDPGESQSEEV